MNSFSNFFNSLNMDENTYILSLRSNKKHHTFFTNELPQT
jgi:hypothetical protein